MIRAALAGVALCCLLTACAGGPPRRGPEGGGPNPPGPRLFVSPAGEPFRAGRGGQDGLAVWFDRTDADKDGRLDRTEFVADFARFFAVVDADGGGVISVLESNRYESEILPEITGAMHGGGEAEGPMRGGQSGRGPRGPNNGFRGALSGAAPYGITGDPQPIRAADHDMSQTVSRDEFLSHAGNLFARLDANRDGVLTLAELALKRAGPQRPPRGGMGGGGGPGGRRPR